MSKSAVLVLVKVDGKTVQGRVLEGRAHAWHMLQKPAAWCFHPAVLSQARAAGAELVQVTVAETGAVYECELADFAAHGFTVSRGHGEQVGLTLTRWHVAGAPSTTSASGAVHTTTTSWRTCNRMPFVSIY